LGTAVFLALVFELSISQIRKFGISVFYRSRLSTISVPSSVTTIGSDCFSSIQTLFEIHFEPNSCLTTIPSALAIWTGVQTLQIPGSVTSITPMSGLGALSSISFGDNSPFRVIEQMVVHPNGDLILGFGSVLDMTIPNWIKVIASGAFAWRINIQSVIIPDGVEILRAHCFSNCWKLDEVIFGDDSQLQVIESNAFYECGALPAIEIPRLVEALGASCFRGCRKLRSVKF
jgi:hypothetical protein